MRKYCALSSHANQLVAYLLNGMKIRTALSAEIRIEQWSYISERSSRHHACRDQAIINRYENSSLNVNVSSNQTQVSVEVRLSQSIELDSLSLFQWRVRRGSSSID